MKIKQPKHIDDSKTVQAADKCDRLQTILVGGSATIALAWFLVGAYSPKLQQRFTELAVPAMTAIAGGAKVGSYIYNRSVRDGRLDVGDVWTLVGEFGPDPGEVVAQVLLNSREEYERLEAVQDFIQQGVQIGEAKIALRASVDAEKTEIDKPSNFSIKI